jgi:asparagine synthase (glutamine-hydrolysing)
MCGISGMISADPGRISEDRLKQMTDVISHRGPDGEGYWISDDGKIGFGHRRLSIIDLGCGGQPMHYQERYTIIFNGEIYNYIELKETLSQQGYVFKTHSDTEVIMALYDRDREKCLQLMDGMFALVIYDKKQHTIFIARDRFGEKPFFYSYEPGAYFYFGSEMKVLWAAGIQKEVNQRMLYNYLEYNFLENPADQSETFFDHCTRLPHSHYLTFSVNDCRITSIEKYFDIDLSAPGTSISRGEAEEQFRHLFTNSVKRRLRSDVPVGSSLSGGLDSSLVVCTIDALKEGTAQVQKTFSARFPGFAKDEGHFMQQVTDKTNTEAIYVYPDHLGMIENIDKIIYHQEEPFGSSSIYAQYCVMQAARENNVPVLLDGQGADEFLAGYHSYFTNFFNELRLNHPEKYRQEYKAYQQLQAENQVNGVVKKDLKYFIRSRTPYLINPLKRSLSYIKQHRSPLFSADFYAAHQQDSFVHIYNYKSLNDALHYSLLQGPLQQLLRFADRNSMSHSVEVRLPFLSHELVRFVFSLPAEYKIHNGWTKWIMRSAFQDLLPPAITWRKDKIGYEPPQQNWMENKDVKDRVQHSKKKLYDAGIISKVAYDKTIAGGAAIDAKNKTWPLWIAGSMLK